MTSITSPGTRLTRFCTTGTKLKFHYKLRDSEWTFSNFRPLKTNSIGLLGLGDRPWATMGLLSADVYGSNSYSYLPIQYVYGWDSHAHGPAGVPSLPIHPFRSAPTSASPAFFPSWLTCGCGSTPPVTPRGGTGRLDPSLAGSPVSALAYQLTTIRKSQIPDSAKSLIPPTNQPLFHLPFFGIKRWRGGRASPPRTLR